MTDAPVDEMSAWYDYMDDDLANRSAAVIKRVRAEREQENAAEQEPEAVEEAVECEACDDALADEPDDSTTFRRIIMARLKKKARSGVAIESLAWRTVIVGMLRRNCASLEDCGTGAGGFKSGNDCAAGGGGGFSGAVSRNPPSSNALAKRYTNGNSGATDSPEREARKQEARDLLAAVRSQGGFTYNAITKSSPTTGYVVSINPEHEVIHREEKIGARDIRVYMNKHAELWKNEPDAQLGAWHDKSTGRIVLDVVRVYDDAGTAERLTRKHKQDGYYDIKNGQTVELTSVEGRRRGIEAYSGGIPAGRNAGANRGATGRDAARLATGRVSPDRAGPTVTLRAVILERLRANRQSMTLENCGTGAGGFQSGNDCAAGGGGGGSSDSHYRRRNAERSRAGAAPGGAKTDDEIRAEGEQNARLADKDFDTRTPQEQEDAIKRWSDTPEKPSTQEGSAISDEKLAEYEKKFGTDAAIALAQPDELGRMNLTALIGGVPPHHREAFRDAISVANPSMAERASTTLDSIVQREVSSSVDYYRSLHDYGPDDDTPERDARIGEAERIARAASTRLFGREFDELDPAVRDSLVQSYVGSGEPPDSGRQRPDAAALAEKVEHGQLSRADIADQYGRETINAVHNEIILRGQVDPDAIGFDRADNHEEFAGDERRVARASDSDDDSDDEDDDTTYRSETAEKAIGTFGYVRGESQLDETIENVGVDPVEALEKVTAGWTEYNSDYRVDFDSAEASGYSLTVKASLVDDTGASVGQMNRTFKNDGGSLEVDHDLFTLSEDMQGKGIAKKMFAQGMDYYEQIGVQKINVTAALEAGGYTWARFGFVPDERDWHSLRGTIERNWKNDKSTEFAERYGHEAYEKMSEKLDNALANDDPTGLWEVADLKQGDHSVGRDLLAGWSWSGGLDLRDGTAMKRFNEYTGRTKPAPLVEQLAQIESRLQRLAVILEARP